MLCDGRNEFEPVVVDDKTDVSGSNDTNVGRIDGLGVGESVDSVYIGESVGGGDMYFVGCNVGGEDIVGASVVNMGARVR